MGQWNLLPADSSGNWHGPETSGYFKKIFGFGKGAFIIQTLDDDMQHPYFPQFYIDYIYNYIKKTNRDNYKKLAKILSSFYKLRIQCRQSISKTAKLNLKNFSNKELVKFYKFNRDWAHRVTPFDQFGWIAEDYWPPLMKNILINKLGLKDDSAEYHKVLFSLTKPEKISTTLKEKQAVLAGAIKIKQRKIKLLKASQKLARLFGYMPVFTFGAPWDENHYLVELKEVCARSLVDLKNEYSQLKDYSKIRNQELAKLVKQYKIQPEDLQKFIDFSLALDVRNEAEYLVSLCGFYLLPIYNEIAKRLYVSVKQLRNLVKKDIIACLEGRTDPQEIFSKQGKIIGWVFNKSMTEIKYLSSKEAQKFFTYLNKHAANLQGHDEQKGICASPGKISGRAKVVNYISEIDKVKSGDILITKATTIDYLPAMKRAAAFVTEVGGLTCHAAVVAREFGVPSVVSLKNATKNFKDSDLVEVDADKGVVRKI